MRFGLAVLMGMRVSRLEGKTILITRADRQSGEFARQIENLGGRPLLFPVITITEPVSWEECDRSIQNVRAYDGIVFTSSNAVWKFFQRCKTLGAAVTGVAGVYAVGSRTAGAIEEEGLTVTGIPQRFSASDLAEWFKQKEVRGKSFLHPRGEIAGNEIADVLTSLGAQVDAPVVYRTVDADPGQRGALLDLISKGAIDVITFASPSAARSFFRLMPTHEVLHRDVRPLIAVIGRTTEGEVAVLGVQPDIVADVATIDGMLSAIVDHYAMQADDQ